jgi:hypothetical protein
MVEKSSQTFQKKNTRHSLKMRREYKWQDRR